MILQLKVSNMACSACAKAITTAVTAVDPAAKVEANTKAKVASI